MVILLNILSSVEAAAEADMVEAAAEAVVSVQIKQDILLQVPLVN
tara:strand:- start:444 stop:578 length:135 start_codon:yes stop_codon:yes gene_type:complete